MFFGDAHVQCEFVIRFVEKYHPEAIVLLGDIEAQRPLEVELATILDLTEVWWIHANHDTSFETEYDSLVGSAFAHRTCMAVSSNAPTSSRLEGA